MSLIDNQVQERYDKFWKNIVCNPDGTINIEQVKKELSDFYFVMNEVPKVYMHITNGLLSKCNYHAHVVTSESDDCYQKGFYEDIKEVIENMIEDGETLQDLLEYVNKFV